MDVNLKFFRIAAVICGVVMVCILAFRFGKIPESEQYYVVCGKEDNPDIQLRLSVEFKDLTAYAEIYFKKNRKNPIGSRMDIGQILNRFTHSTDFIYSIEYINRDIIKIKMTRVFYKGNKWITIDKKLLLPYMHDADGSMGENSRWSAEWIMLKGGEKETLGKKQS